MTPREVFAAGLALGVFASPFLGLVVTSALEWRAAWREGGES